MASDDPGSLRSALAAARRRLTGAGIEAAALEARLLAAAALGCEAAALVGGADRSLTETEAAEFDVLLGRRLTGEPIAYILGRREFWSLSLRVNRDTLIPRPDSETLIEAAVAWARQQPGGVDQSRRVLDLGTGSGCLLLALLQELPGAFGIGVDLSPAALACARGNAEALGFAPRCAFVCGDWAEALAGTFELIVCNPPYLTDAEWERLMPDVRLFEPERALRGGHDGCAAYRRILPMLAPRLATGGRAFFEIGGPSAAEGLRMVFQSELQVIEIINDLAGRPRCLVAAAPVLAVCKKSLGNQVFPV